MTREQNEEKKRYLRRYIGAEKYIDQLTQELADIRYDKTHPSMVYDDMPHAHSPKDLSDYAAKVDELETLILKETEKRVKLCVDITKAIARMNNDTEQMVLRLRYIKGMGWEQIAVEIGYEWAQMHRIHSRALANINIDDTE